MEENFNAYNFASEVRMILNYPEADLHAVAGATVPDVRRFVHARAAGAWITAGEAGEYPIFQVRQMFSRAMVRFIEPVLVNAHWVETTPVMMDMSEVEWSQQPLFLKKGAPVAEELIVEPATVMDLLEKIRKMQAPEQAAIRARQHRGEVPQVHASIITFTGEKSMRKQNGEGP